VKEVDLATEKAMKGLVVQQVVVQVGRMVTVRHLVVAILNPAVVVNCLVALTDLVLIDLVKAALNLNLWQMDLGCVDPDLTMTSRDHL